MTDPTQPDERRASESPPDEQERTDDELIRALQDDLQKLGAQPEQPDQAEPEQSRPAGDEG